MAAVLIGNILAGAKECISHVRNSLLGDKYQGMAIAAFARRDRSKAQLKMNRLALALLLTFFAGAASAARAQSVSRFDISPTMAPSETDPARKALNALKRLQKDVIVYRDAADFSRNGRLAAVPYEIFNDDLRTVTRDVSPLLARIESNKLRTELENALDSFKDGAFWWSRIHQRRVIHVSSLAYENRSAADSAFAENVPYTVVVHWRQADKYLQRAESLLP